MRKALGLVAALPLLAGHAPVGAAPSGTGWVYDAAYLDHDAGAGHPESPERLRAIVAHLETVGLMDKLTPIRPTPAPLEWLTTIHSPEYVASVERACREGRTLLDAGDTGICPKSYSVALLAAGGVLEAVDAVMAGSVRNAFCAVRPPGHHALRDRAMGFCLFHNVAIGARYAQGKYGLKKVLIVDWDVHHGNGTQAAFYEDPTVLYFSVHRSPFYPGSGAETETGSGPGEGYTVNVPLPAGSGDEEYVKAFEEVLKPKALSFRPDFVFISAGFDAHEVGALDHGADGVMLIGCVKDRCHYEKGVDHAEGQLRFMENLYGEAGMPIRVLKSCGSMLEQFLTELDGLVRQIEEARK